MPALRSTSIGAVTVGILLSASAALATTPTTLNFTRIEPSNNVEDLGSQLSVTVAPVSGQPNQIDFTFRNNVGIDSSISEIYFDDGTLLAGSIITQFGANFTYGSATPPGLPGGNNLAPPFMVTMDFLADRGPGNPMNGIDEAADFVTIRFDLQGTQTCDDVLAALADESLRIGMHVVSLGAAQGSDAYVNGAPGGGPDPEIACSISGPNLVYPDGSAMYTVTETTGITSPLPTFAWTITGDGLFDNGMTTTTGASATVNAGDTCGGMYTLEVTVTSGALSDTCTFSTSVGDNEDPTFDMLPLSAPTVECGDPTDPANTGTPTASDNCDDSVDVTFTDSTLSTCGGTSVITRTWTATDNCGNTATADQTITVVDTTDPTFATFPMDTTVECGQSTAPSATGTPTGSDTCSTFTITSSDDFTPGCGDTGVIVRTWTITDDCGNDDTRDQTITIEDNTPPTIDCPRDVTIARGASYDPDVNPAVGTATGSDNCGDVEITYTDLVTHGTGNIVHVIERTWKATDECGLMNTCEQIITVIDKCIWTQGEWDGVDGQTSEIDTAVDGTKTADDFCLKEGFVYELTSVSVCMLTNSDEYNAILEIYEDCNGCPGEPIDCGPFEDFTAEPLQRNAIDDLDLVKFTFNTARRVSTDEYGNEVEHAGLWLKGGCYWLSPVGIGDGSGYDRAFWATAAGDIVGSVPKTQAEPFKVDGWQPVDGLNVTCTNFAFELTGDCCCILQDNGEPDRDDVAGAVDTTGLDCFNADDFLIPKCTDPADICFFSAYIWTNCDCERTKLDIRWDECGEIAAFDFATNGGITPDKCVPMKESIEFEGQTLSLYRVEWHNPQLPLGRPGQNAWAVIEVQGTGSLQERGIWAFADRCDTDCDIRFNPGHAVCHPQGITEYESVGRDYSFCIAARENQPVNATVAPEPCAADFNGDGAATVTDMLDFLEVYFEGCDN